MGSNQTFRTKVGWPPGRGEPSNALPSPSGELRLAPHLDRHPRKRRPWALSPEPWPWASCGTSAWDGTRISSFEGGSDTKCDVPGGFFGAVAGFIIGIVCSRHVVQGTESHFSPWGQSDSGMDLWPDLCAGVLAWLAADLPPTRDGQPHELELELRFPPAVKPPAPEGGRSECHPDAGGNDAVRGHVNFDVAKAVGIRGALGARRRDDPLRTAASQKTVYVSLEEQHGMYIPISWEAVRRNPTFNGVAGSTWNRLPEIRMDPSSRRHVVQPTVSRGVSTPPPTPPSERTAAEREAAAFSALTPEAPFRTGFAFCGTGCLWTALAHRPAFYGGLMATGN